VIVIEKKYDPGDLIAVPLARKFPITLREGPGYIFPRKNFIEPGRTAVILEMTIGHGSHLWLKVLVTDDNMGWIPCSMIEKI
jgi:hypothetical protein